MAAERVRQEHDGGGGQPHSRQPRLTGGRKNKFTVSLSDEQLVQIEPRAAAAGVGVARYLAEVAFAGDAQTATERRALIAEFLAVRRLVAAVGNNLNQLARTANATGELPAELSATLHATARVIGRLDAAVDPLGLGTGRRS